ncbi:MAG TPA: hypothetical protein VE996_00495 [Terriglobales bacterium]|nr:hypothetical protein [Terriglobales bacterium]
MLGAQPLDAAEQQQLIGDGGGAGGAADTLPELVAQAAHAGGVTARRRPE